MENKKNINNIEYVLVGDYYIPDLKLSNEELPIGKYGRMHRGYLKEHNPMMFNDLVLDGHASFVLPKPFTTRALAERIHDALHSDRP